MKGDVYHIVPEGDLREHTLTPDCWCHPRSDDALDQREKYETGELELH